MNGNEEKGMLMKEEEERMWVVYVDGEGTRRRKKECGGYRGQREIEMNDAMDGRRVNACVRLSAAKER